MSHSFFQNRNCEFFPCHKMQNTEDLNCLFCYCPLYALGEQCGGSFTYTEKGIKDCSGCTFPHRKENYERVNEKLREVIALVKKPGVPGETP